MVDRRPADLRQFGGVNGLNSHFVNIATDPNYNRSDITDYLASGPSTDYLELDEFQVYKMLSFIAKTAPGPDGIPSWVYKKCAAQLSSVVCHLFNLSLKSGIVPREWKHAIVAPVPKVTLPQEPGDFRPISVTSILSRLVERHVVRHHLLPAVPTELLQDQFAFRNTGSTTAAIAYLTHHATRLLEEHHFVRCIMVDFKKAFDSVLHAVLIRALATLHLPPNIHNWIVNFLLDRTQAVWDGADMSHTLAITRSIIQGSGLGPFLWLVYFAGFKLLSIYNILVKFADDTSILSTDQYDYTIVEEFNHLIRWADEHMDFKLTCSRHQRLSFNAHASVPSSSLLSYLIA